MNDWDEILAFACALPDVAMASYYGRQVPKLNGKPIVSPSRLPDSFVLYVRKSEKELLFETDPEAFWQTDHFANYPALLARYGRARERVALYLHRRWWDLAKKPQRIAAGMAERP